MRLYGFRATICCQSRVIRYVDDEDQVLSESNMSFQMLDVDSIPREERLDQLESDILDKGHEIMRHIYEFFT
jgi:hypothetical protein